MARQSKMREIAEERNQDVRTLLIEAFAQHGNQSDVARALGVSQPTISVWLVKLGLRQWITLRDVQERVQ